MEIDKPDGFYERVCRALAQRAGGLQHVETLGLPYGAGSFSRWQEAGLLSAQERRALEALNPDDGSLEILEIFGPLKEAREWSFEESAAQTLPDENAVLELDSLLFSGVEARFEWGEELEEDNFFRCYEGRDRLLSRPVSLYQYRPEGVLLAQEFVEALRRQASLQHPNIQPIYELGTRADGLPFFASARPLKRNLANLLKESASRPQSLHFLLEILLDVARALSFAHSQGLTHRDLRPNQIGIGDFGERRVQGWFRSLRLGEFQEPELQARLEPINNCLGFLAPERLRGGLAVCGEAADVWSLGAILYAILNHRPPLMGRSREELLAQLKTKQPALSPPGPERLQELCLASLCLEEEARSFDARSFATALESFLEGSQLKKRRLEEMERRLTEAEQRAERFSHSCEELHRACFAEGRARLLKINSLASQKEQREAWRLQEQAEREFGEAEEAYLHALSLLPRYNPNHPGFQHLQRCALSYVERGLLRLPRGHLRSESGALGLKGRGRLPASLDLQLSKPGTRIDLHNYKDEQGTLSLGPGRSLGLSPLPPLRLPPGPLLLLLKQEGRSFSLALDLKAGEQLYLKVFLPDEQPEDCIFIPAGPFKVGLLGRMAPESDALPGGRCRLPGYFLKRRPLSFGEYKPFLDHLCQRNPTEAKARAPRPFISSPPFWHPIEGRYPLPFTTPTGRCWSAEHPLSGISPDDAHAYLNWRSRRDGLKWRLPTELEWEKAARGAEGRIYPWGERPEPSFCDHLSADGGEMMPAPLGAHPRDRSVYGVECLAGGVREYCEGYLSPRVVLRGGAWCLPFGESRAFVREAFHSRTQLMTLGFRMALDAEGPGPIPAEIVEEPAEQCFPLQKHSNSLKPSAAGFLSEELSLAGRSIFDETPRETVDPWVEPLELGVQRYQLEEEIARGSMGQVVQAYDRLLNRQVALKILHAEHRNSPLVRYRFAMEARITGRLQHPLMLPIYDLGLLNERPFFVMKPVEGLSLQDILQARAAGVPRVLVEYSLDKLITLMRRVCLGVAYANEHHIIHRDLKPANILVGSQGEVVIVDLGLARQLRPDSSEQEEVREAVQLGREGRVTQAGSIIGTPYYMPPEQAMGLQDAVGRSSDVYGLGAILYHILTHRPPFSGTQVKEVLAKVRRGNPRPPRQLLPEISPELEEIVMRALSMAPEDRQESALELAEALECWQEENRLSQADKLRSSLREREAAKAIQRAERSLESFQTLQTRFKLLRRELRQSIPLERRRLLWQAQRQIERRGERLDNDIALAYRSLSRGEERAAEAARLLPLLQARILWAEAERREGDHALYRSLRRPLGASPQHPPPPRQESSFEFDSSKFLYIPAGVFLYGGDPFTDEGPARRARLGPYLIAIYPVTCGEYRSWLESLDPKAQALRQPRLSPGGLHLWGRRASKLFGAYDPHRPVTGINLSDAHAYTRWRALQEGRLYRLPTSAEWEKAARGEDARLYPWGNFDPLRCHPEELGIYRIGCYSEDRSPYGLRDLSTGVLEWTITAAREQPNACYVRGGCSALNLHGPCLSRRIAWDPRLPSPYLGFRLVIAVEPPQKRSQPSFRSSGANKGP